MAHIGAALHSTLVLLTFKVECAAATRAGTGPHQPRCRKLAQVPAFNAMYELYDACTIMFFFRNKHIQIDLGTGNNNKINWALSDKQEFIDIVETVYKGARKGRGLVVSPKGAAPRVLHAMKVCMNLQASMCTAGYAHLDAELLISLLTGACSGCDSFWMWQTSFTNTVELTGMLVWCRLLHKVPLLINTALAQSSLAVEQRTTLSWLPLDQIPARGEALLHCSARAVAHVSKTAHRTLSHTSCACSLHALETK